MIALDNAQQGIIHMVSDFSKDLRTTLGVVTTEVANLSTRLNLDMRVMGNKIPTEGVAQFNKIKISEPNFYGV